MPDYKKRTAVVFPKSRKILDQLGENITLAMKRRHITQTILHQRTGFSRPTIRKIMRGDSTVSIGHYVLILSVLGLADDLANVARDEVLESKLAEIEQMKAAQCK